jgi:DNA-binding transcriptional ArsR family regulator
MPVIEILPGEVGAHRVRLAISPLEEVLNAVRTLNRPGRAPVHARWAAANRTAIDVPELVALITGDVYFPDFLSPPSDDPRTTVDDQLRLVARTPPGQVRREIAMSIAGRDVPPELFADPVKARDLLIEQMRQCWDALIEPIWPRLRDVLDTDIDYRARQFRTGGLTAVLTGIHPGIAVDGPRILIPTIHSGRLALDDRGLQLVPSVFAQRLGLMMVPPWQPSLVYPARGSATLWEDVPAPAGDPLAGVLGRTKARVLRELATPATTTTLATRLGVAPSTISEHVRALTAAGLLSGRRTGRSVQYRRSSLGDELVSSAT